MTSHRDLHYCAGVAPLMILIRPLQDNTSLISPRAGRTIIHITIRVPIKDLVLEYLVFTANRTVNIYAQFKLCFASVFFTLAVCFNN